MDNRMTTNMHRLQISLPDWEVEFLRERARRDGTSVAEVIRELVRLNAEESLKPGNPGTLWEVAGIAQDAGKLQNGIPVSERPEIYLA